MAKKKEFEENVLWQSNEYDTEGDNYQHIIRVVSFNGNQPVLEKRTFMTDYKDRSKVIMGKAAGFNIDDWAFVLENKKKIEKFLNQK